MINERLKVIIELKKKLRPDFSVLIADDNLVSLNATKNFCLRITKNVKTISADYILKEFMEKEFNDSEFDLIIMDLFLNETNTYKYMEMFKEKNPEIIIFITIDADKNIDVSKKVKKISKEIFYKPIKLSSIVEAFYKMFLSFNERNSKKVLENTMNLLIPLYFVQENNQDVVLLNTYKGLPIVSKAKIVTIEEGFIILEVTMKQLKAIAREKIVILESENLEKNLLFSLDSLDYKKRLVKVINPTTTNAGSKLRKYLRVEVNRRTFIILARVKTKNYDVIIKDMSQNSFSLVFNANLSFLSEGDEILLNISFILKEESLDNNAKGYKTIKFKKIAKVIRAVLKGYDKTIVIVSVEYNQEELENIISYIKNRELEIIEEFKKDEAYKMIKPLKGV